MPSQYTRADSLRSYLTGANSDGGVQADFNACFGNYRSSTEAASLGITVFSPLTNVAVLFAGGANPAGNGILSATDSSHLTWQPNGATGPGSPAAFSGTNDIEIVEALDTPGQYLRVRGTVPFTPGASTVALIYLPDNLFGFDDLSVAQATAGLQEYRAVMYRNESTGQVGNLQLYIAQIGTQQVSDVGSLASSGAGSLTTSGSFADWPSSGWCQIRNSGNTLKEIIYYTAKSSAVLIVPAAGRGLLGTSAVVGSASDKLYSVPGIALAADPTGTQAFGTPIQTIANGTTAPTGVTWNYGITAATGLQLGNVAPNTQVGVWLRRHYPAGAIASPAVLTQILGSFYAF